MDLDALEFQQLEQTSLPSILGGASIVPSRRNDVKAVPPFLLCAFDLPSQWVGGR
jgi:hypothetical protein